MNANRVVDIETIAEAVHNAWWDEKRRQGVTNHPCMIPYAFLTEEQKEFDRATVRAAASRAAKTAGVCSGAKNIKR